MRDQSMAGLRRSLLFDWLVGLAPPQPDHTLIAHCSKNTFVIGIRCLLEGEIPVRNQPIEMVYCFKKRQKRSHCKVISLIRKEIMNHMQIYAVT